MNLPTFFGRILMIRLHRRRTLFFGSFALVATFLFSAFGADEPGFKPIFNGKDLTGWRLGKADLADKTASDDGRFAVKDGILVISGSKDRPPKNTEIETVDSYDGDFILRLEFRASRDANSGLHLRDKAFKHQLQIRDYPRVGPYKTLKNYKDGDWNAIEVTVTGTKAHCTCNGEILEDALEIPAKGPLALQSEINVLEYRNIRIKTAN
jgi:3-keto-disaccharide hydrolase